jgi:hypothetical protein
MIVVTSKWNVSYTESGQVCNAIFSYVDNQLLTLGR